MAATNTPTVDDTTPRRGRGRPRNSEAHRTILEAAAELLATGGFETLTIDAVAAKVRCSKATIYRRWPSKLPLVVEAFGQLPGFDDVDTGSVAEDLKQMLRAYIHAFNNTPLASVMPSLAGEWVHNPALSEFYDPVAKQRRQPLIRTLQRGVDRGEIPADVDLELLADIVVGPISVAVFTRGGRISPRMVGPMIDLALRGLLETP